MRKNEAEEKVCPFVRGQEHDLCISDECSIWVPARRIKLPLPPLRDMMAGFGWETEEDPGNGYCGLIK